MCNRQLIGRLRGEYNSCFSARTDTELVQWTVQTGLNEIGRTEEVSGDVITSFECDADRTGSDVIMVNL